MRFVETHLPDALLIEPERLEDERGFFARIFCEGEMQEQGVCTRFVQSSISFSRRKGTLRGMHYQAAPHGEDKLVRCTMGSVYDVIVDIRPESVTYLQWFATHLSSENRCALLVPKQFSHGFLTLTDNTEVLYQMSEFYTPEASRGFRWNDPRFGIEWPEPIVVISDRDKTYADFVAEPPV